MSQATFKIPEFRMPFLIEKIEKLNRKAVKLNCEKIKINILHETFEEVKIHDDDDFPIKKKYFEVEIIGSSPILNGWQFVATIQHEDGVNLFLKKSDFDKTIPQEYSNVSQKCEHCNMDRRRNDTYILYNAEKNVFKQIGRTCLKDFLGHTSPESYALWATLEMKLIDDMSSEDWEESFGGGSRGYDYVSLNDCLSITTMYIRIHGWMSRSKYRELEEQGKQPKSSTADVVSNHLFSPEYSKKIENEDRYNNPKKYAVLDADKKLANDAIEWASSLDVTTDDNYLWNLKAIASIGYCKSKNLGIACSMIAAYQRHLCEIAKIEEEKNKPQSVHVGTIGKREIFTLKVVSIMPFTNDWGTKYLIRFEDENSNILIWWASGSAIHSENIGQSIKIKATVKNHSEYKGIKQTELTRCKVQIENKQISATPTPTSDWEEMNRRL